jgi:hypothetical protein
VSPSIASPTGYRPDLPIPSSSAEGARPACSNSEGTPPVARGRDRGFRRPGFPLLRLASPTGRGAAQRRAGSLKRGDAGLGAGRHFAATGTARPGIRESHRNPGHLRYPRQHPTRCQASRQAVAFPPLGPSGPGEWQLVAHLGCPECSSEGRLSTPNGGLPRCDRTLKSTRSIPIWQRAHVCC